MDQRKLGHTGLLVSEVCLGTMTFGRPCDEAVSRAILDTAFDGGVTFVDTADVYPSGGGLELAGRSEEIVGRWLKGRRHQVVLTTKGYEPMGAGPNDRGLSRKHVVEAVEQSLRRLQTDYIDLYQVHAPDPGTPVEETLRALDELVRQGKIRYLGCSNHQAWHLARALLTSRECGLARYDSVQARYNILFREGEADLLPLCRDQGVGVIVNNVLAGGVLTGKYSWSEPPPATSRLAGLPSGSRSEAIFRMRYWHREHLDAVRGLEAFFAARGKGIAQVAVAWVLAQLGVTSAIVGATSPEQFATTLSALDVTLDDDEVARCNEAWFELPRLRDPEVAWR